ncbi:MAG TPA: hypothetical protein VFY65_20420, partial [Longimicrobium sp.]|nr:hypothetical protein [Longimicrobium sp.]
MPHPRPFPRLAALLLAAAALGACDLRTATLPSGVLAGNAAPAPSALDLDVRMVELAVTRPSAQTGPSIQVPTYPRVRLHNQGTEDLHWSSTSNQPWLRSQPASGTLAPGGMADVTVLADGAQLPGGDYHTGAIIISDSAGASPPDSVDVTVHTALPLALGVPRTGQGLHQTYYVVTVPPGPGTLTVSTSGGAADLYVAYDHVPFDFESPCAEYPDTICTEGGIFPGTYLVMLKGFGDHAGITLRTAIPLHEPYSTKALAFSMTAVQLTWTDRNESRTGYQVARRTMLANGTWGGWANVGSPSASAVVFNSTGLTAGVAYEHAVRTCYQAACSAWSYFAPVSIPTAPPSPPLNVHTQASSRTSATTTWSDASSDETGFTVLGSLRNLDGSWGPYVTAGSGGPNYTGAGSSGLVPGREYRFKVLACNPAGCSPTTLGNIVRMPTSFGPPGFSARPIATGMWLQWTDTITGEQYFEIERFDVAATGPQPPFKWIANVPANQGVYHDGGVAPGQYQYRIRACMAPIHCTLWAYTDYLRIRPLPSAPSNVAASALSATAMRLEWGDPGDHATYTQLHRARRNADGTWGAFGSMTTLNYAGSLFIQEGGLTSGGTYRYQVRGCNHAGCSPWAESNVVTLP